MIHSFSWANKRKMSLPIIQDITSPQIPFLIPLPGLMTNDTSQLSVNLTARSSFEISLKTSSLEKIDSRFPLNLFVTCRCGKNKKWDFVQKSTTPIPAATFLIIITLDTEEEYHVDFDGNLYATFPHMFLSFASEFFEVKVYKGSAQLKSLLYTREMKWIGFRIGLPLPETALNCGKDDQNNDIYIERGLKNNNLLIVSAKLRKMRHLLRLMIVNGQFIITNHYKITFISDGRWSMRTKIYLKMRWKKDSRAKVKKF